MPRPSEDLAMAWLDGRFPRLIDKLTRIQILVLDDWGSHGQTEQKRGDLLEIFEERHAQIHLDYGSVTGRSVARNDWCPDDR
jgi:DNA replication protein DnaC